MRLVLILLISMGLIGCTPPPPTVITKTRFIEVPKAVAPNPISLSAPTFYVVSMDKNIEGFIMKMQEETGGVFIAITPMGYQLLTEDVQEFYRYIKQQKASISYYEKNCSSAEQPKNE